MVKLRRGVSKTTRAKAHRHNPRVGRHRESATHEIMMSNRKKRNRARNRVARAARRVARRHKR